VPLKKDKESVNQTLTTERNYACTLHGLFRKRFAALLGEYPSRVECFLPQVASDGSGHCVLVSTNIPEKPFPEGLGAERTI
jgi:hypothetical protein